MYPVCSLMIGIFSLCSLSTLTTEENFDLQISASPAASAPDDIIASSSRFSSS